MRNGQWIGMTRARDGVSVRVSLILLFSSLVLAGCDSASPGQPNVIIAITHDLVTSEDQTTASFGVVLSAQPTSAVIIPLVSADLSEGSLSTNLLEFTPGNWSTPQTVIITGVDDDEVDGDIVYSIIVKQVTSIDDNYAGIDPADLTVTNLDNDASQGPSPPSAAVNVSPVSGLVTSEAGASAVFSVFLSSIPAGDVAVTASSSDASEGTVAPANIIFAPDNWNIEQQFTVTGVDDAGLDGDITYTIQLSSQSSDVNYDNIIIDSVTVINTDNESPPSPAQPGIAVAPTEGLVTSENATTATFTIVLESQPADRVDIDLMSTDATEGTVQPETLQFDGSSWNQQQTVTLTGVDDSDVDGDVPYNIDIQVRSSDAGYNGIAVAPVAAVNQDNDTPPAPGITVSPTGGLTTSEDVTTATVSIVLESQPTSVVVIDVSSSNIMEGTVQPPSLEFTTTNWNAAQEITVTGVDDAVVDGDVNYNIEFTVQSNDADYDGMSIAPVSVVNQDNDPPQAAAGISVSPASGLMTSEDLASAEFTVLLDSQPAADVTITLISSDTTEGMVMPESIVFSASNWGMPQTVTVTGVDDSVVDGDISYGIALTVQSGDADYDGFSVAPVGVTNQDNDVSQPPPVPDPVSYNFIVALGTLEITPSEITGNGATTFPVWGFSATTANADVPGQVVAAVTGQTVNVEIINDHARDHGFEVKGLLTGTPVILSGELGNFQFTAQEAGVYLYYDPDLRSREMGMFGAVVVRPADGSSTAWEGGPAFDQERTWVITDMDDSWNRVSTFLPVDVSQYDPNYFLLNGKNGFAAKQDPASTLEGVVGETFLVRIVNAGQYDQSLHFHANHFQIISQDGVKVTDITDAPWVTTVNVKRGSTAMVLYTLDKPGTFPVHVHSAQMETGNGVYLNGTATFIVAQ